jgi:hypothetical protein
MFAKIVRLRFIHFFSFWLGLHVLTSQSVWAGTALADLAASMKPGTWAELKTNNINPTLTNTRGSSGFVFGYAEEVRWDPVTRKLYHIGMDHGQGQLRFLAYSETNNTWSVIAEAPANMNCSTYPPRACTPNHSYDHAALDPAGRHFYWRYGYADKKIHRYHLDNQTWEILPPNNLMQYVQCCGAIEYFPEMGGLIWVQGQSGAKGQGGVYLFNPSTSTWSALGATNTTGYPMDGTFNNFAEYNPVHKVMIFGGGDNGKGTSTRILYKMTSTGVITALKNAPFDLGIQHGSKVTVDPVTGDFLVFNGAHQFWKYNVLTDTWAQLTDPPMGIWPPFPTNRIHGMVVGYIDTYGLIGTVSCGTGGAGPCRIFVYKHDSGGNPASDSVAPSTPTALGVSIVSASQINLSWNASTDNIGVAGYHIFRNGIQIGTTNSTTYHNTGLSPSTSYTYSVVAYDMAGNVSGQSLQANGTTLTTPLPPTEGLTFAQKCAQPDVINCFGFDDDAALRFNWPKGTVCDNAFAGKQWYDFSASRSGLGNTAATVQNGRCVYPIIDTTVKKSGAGALKFTVPSNSGANSSGYFSEPFRRNSNGTFPYISPNSSLGAVMWGQWRQMFDDAFLSTRYVCLGGNCGGQKQIIWYGNPPNGASSSQLEVTHNNGWQRKVPTMYGQAGYDDYGVQDVRGCKWLQLDPRGTNDSALYTEPPCIRYKPNTWMEFTVRIEVRGAPNAPESRVQMWVDGQLAVDNPKAKINWGRGDGDGIGQFLISPYHTRKDPNQVHPVAHTWVDDLIISTQPISMGRSSTTVTRLPNAPSNAQLKAQ